MKSFNSGCHVAVGSIEALAEDFLAEQELRGYSPRTINNYKEGLRKLFSFLKENNIEKISQINRKSIEKYQRQLHRAKTMQPSSQSLRLITIIMFFRWLTTNNHILYNPTDSIDLPKLPQRLPGNVLSIEEVEKVFSQVDLNKPHGIRDRAILETFFATGIRRRELIFLSLADIDFDRKLILIRHGKAAKERYVPISERALYWIQKYIDETRDFFILAETDILFLSSTGDAFMPRSLARRMRDYINKANIGKKGSCHIFRHTLATLMLENGANLRYIQELLGHAHLQSTQVYTRVSIAKLKEVHSKTHPGAKMKNNCTTETD